MNEEMLDFDILHLLHLVVQVIVMMLTWVQVGEAVQSQTL